MKAVVFDMDGVIFDSETLVFRMWKVVAEKYGVADIEETCRACLGINATVTREIFFERYGQDFPYDKYKKEMSDLFHANAAGGKLPKKPGIRELLEYLRRENIKTAVASSTRRDLVTRELEEACFPISMRSYAGIWSVGANRSQTSIWKPADAFRSGLRTAMRSRTPTME